MIRFREDKMRAAATQRKAGYVEAVMKAATAAPGGMLEMSREDYKAIAEKYAIDGPGAELKKLLKVIGIVSTPTCKCNQRARQMDEMGCQWCRDNEDVICDWMQEEAKKRKMLFVRSAARLMLRRAIAIAERNNGTT